MSLEKTIKNILDNRGLGVKPRNYLLETLATGAYGDSRTPIEPPGGWGTRPEEMTPVERAQHQIELANVRAHGYYAGEVVPSSRANVAREVQQSGVTITQRTAQPVQMDPVALSAKLKAQGINKSPEQIIKEREVNAANRVEKIDQKRPEGQPASFTATGQTTLQGFDAAGNYVFNKSIQRAREELVKSQTPEIEAQRAERAAQRDKLGLQNTEAGTSPTPPRSAPAPTSSTTETQTPQNRPAPGTSSIAPAPTSSTTETQTPQNRPAPGTSSIAPAPAPRSRVMSSGSNISTATVGSSINQSQVQTRGFNFGQKTLMASYDPSQARKRFIMEKVMRTIQN